MALLVTLFVTCAAAAAGQSSARPGGCVTTKQFSQQDAGVHAVILGEWGATVRKPLRATCDNTRAVASSRRPARSHRSVPFNMRGRDQLSVPGWPNELPF